MRKVVYGGAMSLDGFIAGPEVTRNLADKVLHTVTNRMIS